MDILFPFASEALLSAACQRQGNLSQINFITGYIDKAVCEEKLGSQ